MRLTLPTSDRASISSSHVKHIWQRMHFLYNFSKRKNRLQKEAHVTIRIACSFLCMSGLLVLCRFLRMSFLIPCCQPVECPAVQEDEQGE